MEKLLLFFVFVFMVISCIAVLKLKSIRSKYNSMYLRNNELKTEIAYNKSLVNVCDRVKMELSKKIDKLEKVIEIQDDLLKDYALGNPTGTNEMLMTRERGWSQNNIPGISIKNRWEI